MTDQMRAEFIDVTKYTISRLADELKSELDRIDHGSPNLLRDEVFANCAGLVAKIKKRLIQLEKLAENDSYQ